MRPVRVQRRREKGWRMPPNTVYVGRPTQWGNPFAVGENAMWLGLTDLPFPLPTARQPGEYDNAIRVERIADRARGVELFRAFVAHYPHSSVAAVDQLRGKNLACWCPLDQPCHADVLLELANR